MTTTRIRRGEKATRVTGGFAYYPHSLILFLAVITLCCGANESILRSRKESPTPLPAASPDSFEKDIAAMNEAEFKWIYVFRRWDGAELNSEDKGVIRTNAAETNRRVLSDSGKAVIIGSNFRIGDTNLKALTDRFDVLDRSLPEQIGPTPAPEKKK